MFGEDAKDQVDQFVCFNKTVELLLSACNLMRDDYFIRQQSEKLELIGHIQQNAKIIKNTVGNAIDYSADVVTLFNQENLDEDKIRVSVAMQQKATSKILKTSTDLEKRSLKLATMEEDHQNHMKKVGECLKSGVKKVTSSNYKTKAKNHLEAEFTELYPSVLVSQEYIDRPLIGESEIARLGFCKTSISSTKNMHTRKAMSRSCGYIVGASTLQGQVMKHRLYES